MNIENKLTKGDRRHFCGTSSDHDHHDGSVVGGGAGP
jgi:hypothetical protein